MAVAEFPSWMLCGTCVERESWREKCSSDSMKSSELLITDTHFSMPFIEPGEKIKDEKSEM